MEGKIITGMTILPIKIDVRNDLPPATLNELFFIPVLCLAGKEAVSDSFVLGKTWKSSTSFDLRIRNTLT